MRVPPGADDTSGQPLDLSPNVRQCSGHSAAAVPTVSFPSTDAQSEGESAMPSRLNRRDFVKLSAPTPAAESFTKSRRFSREGRSEEHTSELQSPDHLVCRL